MTRIEAGVIKICVRQRKPQPKTNWGTGSIIYARKDKKLILTLILTAAHVTNRCMNIARLTREQINDRIQITCLTESGELFAAKYVATPFAEFPDISLLETEFPFPGVPIPEFCQPGEYSSLTGATPVRIFGFADYSFQLQAREAKFTGTDRLGNVCFSQTDIPNGFSGSPILWGTKRIGMVTHHSTHHRRGFGPSVVTARNSLTQWVNGPCQQNPSNPGTLFSQTNVEVSDEIKHILHQLTL
ncbi:serine protease [Candidatus Margulisiibacteriota bacterium]